MQLLVPSADQGGAVGGDDLVRACLRPGPTVPRPPQPGPGFGAGVRVAPLGLVAVEVAADLRGAGTEPADVGRQLGQLTGGRVEGEPVRGEHGAELGVGGDRCVADAVDRGEAVAHPDRVQSPPGSFGEDAGVDLDVQVAVRVTGPGGVVPHHGCFDLGHRHLDLPALGSDPGGGVLGDPADDLLGRPGLGRIEGVGDLGMQRGRERPGLGSVHHDLDEPQRLRVGSQPPLRDTGSDLEEGKTETRGFGNRADAELVIEQARARAG